MRKAINNDFYRQNEEQASICIKGNLAVNFSEHVFFVELF